MAQTRLGGQSTFSVIAATGAFRVMMAQLGALKSLNLVDK